MYRVAHHAEYIALTLVDMHGQPLIGKAGIVIFSAIVQLPDRRYMMALPYEAIPPTRHATIVGRAVVPVTDLMHVATGPKLARAGTQMGNWYRRS